MPHAPPTSVPAVVEGGIVKLPAGSPNANGTAVTIVAGAAAAEDDAADALDPNDPLVRLLRLTGDGPPDGASHVDEYKLGLKRWPPGSGAPGE